MSVPMTDRQWPHTPPQFEVTVWKKGILFDVKALWNFLFRSNLIQPGPTFDFLFNYATTDKRTFYFNLATPFGKAVKKIPYPCNTRLIAHFLKQSQFICNNYITRTRIRPLLQPRHLTFLRRLHAPSSTYPITPSLHNLIRHRLKPVLRTNPPLPPIPLPHTHKTYPKNHYISYPPPTSFVPPITSLSGFDPPSRYPREGVG